MDDAPLLPPYPVRLSSFSLFAASSGVFLFNCIQKLLYCIFAAGFQAVVNAVSFSDQNSFFADFLFGNAVSFTKDSGYINTYWAYPATAVDFTSIICIWRQILLYIINFSCSIEKCMIYLISCLQDNYSYKKMNHRRCSRRNEHFNRITPDESVQWAFSYVLPPPSGRRILRNRRRKGRGASCCLISREFRLFVSCQAKARMAVRPCIPHRTS